MTVFATYASLPVLIEAKREQRYSSVGECDVARAIHHICPSVSGMRPRLR
ncbi:hypothetical protein [Streptomyces sp. IBSBF 3136]